MSDIEITCQDCQTPFQFAEAEQDFYREKGFANPKRCKACRQVRKDQKAGGGGGNRGASSGERPAAPKGGRGQMFDAVCSDCRASTQVPFQPSGGKPVYCRECFQSRRR